MLPAAQLRISADEDRVPVVNSRDVAEIFGKQHQHVLRDIDAIRAHGPKLDHGTWFREVKADHPIVTGRVDRSFNLTRDGFMLLVMGWNGERALALKVHYIEAFNEMERTLREQVPQVTTHAHLIEAIREVVRPLAVRFDGQDVAIERLEVKVGDLVQDVQLLGVQVRKLAPRRRDMSATTKGAHVSDLRMLGGRCPCCGVAEVVTREGERAPFSDFDHFYTNSNPSVDATWLICKPCHRRLTSGELSRHQVEAQFRSYQEKRQRLPNRQPRLF